jgi:hypothetical protein
MEEENEQESMHRIINLHVAVVSVLVLPSKHVHTVRS